MMADQDPPVPPGFSPVQHQQDPPVPQGFSPGQGSGPPPTPSVLEQWGAPSWLQPIGNFVQGMGAGVMSTARGASQLAHWAIPAIPEIPAEYAQPPAGFAGHAGKAVEQGAEFMIPGGAATQAEEAGVKLASKLPGFLGTAGRAAVRAGAQGIPAAAVAGIQSGGDPNAMLWAGGPAAAINAAAPVIKTVATQILGRSTGVGPEVINRAMNASPDLVDAMQNNVSEGAVLDSARDALQAAKASRGAAYQAELAKLSPTQQINLKPVRQDLLKALAQNRVRYSIGKSGELLLDFSSSTIGDAAAQNQVTGVADDIWRWGAAPGESTPIGVDTLKRRIDDVYAPSSNSRAFVQRLKDTTRNLLETQVPNYQKMTSEYARASKFLDNLGDLSLNSKNDGTAIRKLTTTLNQNYEYRKDLLDLLSQFSPTGTDIGAQVAGRQLSRWGARGIAGPLMGTGLVGHLGSLLASGRLLTPQTVAEVMGTFAFTSPRVVGETMRLMGKYAPYVKALPGAAGSMLAPDTSWQPDTSTTYQGVGPPTLNYNAPGKAKGGKVHYDDGGDVQQDDASQDPKLQELIRRRIPGGVIQLGQPTYQQPFRINPEQSKQNLNPNYQDYSNPMTPPPPAKTPALPVPFETQLQQTQPEDPNNLVDTGLITPMLRGTGKLLRSAEEFSEPAPETKTQGLGTIGRVGSGVMEVAQPFMLGSGLASPSALLNTVKVLGGASAAQQVVESRLEDQGYAPEVTQLGGMLTGVLAGGLLHGSLPEGAEVPVGLGDVKEAARDVFNSDEAKLIRSQIGLGVNNATDLAAAKSRQLQQYLQPEQAQARIDQFWKDQPTQLNQPLPVHVLADYAIAGASKIVDGAGKFTDWSKGMLDTFGQQVQPHLRAIWNDAQHIAGVYGWGETGQEEMPLSNRLTVQAGPVATDAPVIAQQAVPHLVQQNLDNLNVFHQRNPTMFADSENYIRGMNELFRPRSGRVPIPPDNLIAYTNTGPALGASIDEVLPQQRALAEEGLQAAGRVRQAYAANSMTPVHTGLYFGWGALSPRQSPYPQEAGFLHAVDSGLGNWIDMAARGQFNESTLPAYLEWSGRILKGTPGAQATSNLNTFGKQFLMNAGKPVENGPYQGMRTIDALHQIIGDQNLSSIDARRRYQQINNGLGVDNKVFSFILLVTGHPDTLVADRVRINDFWDAPKLEQQGLSYTTNEQGMMEPTRNLYDNGLNQAWNGLTGLGMYEAAEKGLADRIQQEYAKRGISDGTLGRWHWETWLAKSGQEVSHGSLGAIAKMGGQGLTGEQAVVGEGVRQGKYNDLSYGVRYERAPDGFRYNWEKSNGDTVSLTPEQHTQVLQTLREMRDKKQAASYTEGERIIPYGTKTSESTDAPWHGLPGINRAALDQLLDRLSRTR